MRKIILLISSSLFFVNAINAQGSGCNVSLILNPDTVPANSKKIFVLFIMRIDDMPSRRNLRILINRDTILFCNNIRKYTSEHNNFYTLAVQAPIYTTDSCAVISLFGSEALDTKVVRVRDDTAFFQVGFFPSSDKLFIQPISKGYFESHFYAID